jgi:pyruvate carboxylase
VLHVFERQCSIQRRYQKVVEVAPCLGEDRGVVSEVIKAAVKMAKQVGRALVASYINQRDGDQSTDDTA